ncbi:MAG: hypothetical protein H0T53_05770 [Herpetosiphonaceae bacterium]|nr:hypothetical protein [Herpetosiphonaceae bacterium]
MTNPDWDDKTSEEKQSVYDRLKNLKGQTDEQMITRYSELGISMYGSLPAYPGVIIETAPDGRLYIVRREGDTFTRVREIEA